MSLPESLTENLIRRARSGDTAALGELLENHRAYLRLLVEREFGNAQARLQGRIDSSDIVQQTCLSVCKRFAQFLGHDAGEFLAWLRQVHEHNIRDTLRLHTQAQKRSVGVEQAWEEFLTNAAEPSRSRASTPSQRAMLNEGAVRLAAVLEQLGNDQREAVRLRHIEGWSLARIAEQLGRSEQAVAGLIKRGIARLRVLLKEE